MLALTHLSPERHPRVAVVVSGLLAVVAVTLPVAAFFSDEPRLLGPLLAMTAGLAAIVIADLRWEGGDVIRLLGLLGTIAAVPAALLPFVPAASIETTRLTGNHRGATAIAVSRHVHESSPTAVVVDAGSREDAVAAAPLAASLGAPLLFTGDGLRGELERLGADEVHLVGAVAGDDALVRALQGDGVDRLVPLAGLDAHATSALVVERLRPDVVFVTSGWVDAVAVTPRLGAGNALLSVTPTTVPDAARDVLGRVQPSSVVVVGGTAAVGAEVIAELRRILPGVRVSRIVGADRWETALALADGPTVEPGPVWIASGDAWPDALSAGVGAAAAGEPLLLVPGDRSSAVTSATMTWLERNRDDLDRVTVVGAVPEVLVDRLVG